MTDIRLPLGGLKFSVRVAILCVRDDRLLANTAQGLGFWFLPGGALATDEDITTCAAREWEEETGTSAGPLRLVGVLENFFGPPHKRQHELGFYFRMDAPPELPDEPFMVLDNAETLCEWVPLTELAARPVYPLALSEFLTAGPGEVRHLVERS
ncbi:NUDIX domain-containing protein [Deinococcus metallilatus]|uniref:8-oxo-dGTP pyrophosphatase MutT (NUDIX family) n=1 Tax=Deinococcus metallilatus TaxID=1211322 RepID=A0AAJ5JZU0_9DEIO|nr:NUDIX domain-containing protein [Deinococcus metallilatus]MBB5295182.1 8-oxo-dGTP pyrophosphatase MutT (NUDIX family) [Deinococcus metallilatus]QBY08652.1 NUDIX domain-containing protein [Deinococcus metallilatus]RXJ10531.1 NUDIX domain-containing protein [Deinococcus metallilatus]TLK26502.1 NUDIX domain-containing protein [Deinococcus metallilatus]GMA14955.1 DNA mismatch repair protein MutT [Deinococcus metallilatus]